MTPKQLDVRRILMGRQIATIRAEKGLTQMAVAKKVGLQRSNIARIERGKYPVGMDIIVKILDVLDQDIFFWPKKLKEQA